ncbi:MAG: epoxyqueuosine reductase QueH [Syntrophobacteraceae bacterium]
MTRILLHICCGPCAVYPISALRDEGLAVHGYFYNPHIQPYREFTKRLGTLRTFVESQNVPLIVRDDYDPHTFFRQVAFRETSRCIYCYSLRLDSAARIAKKSRFDAFTTTLLYSKHQNHQLVLALAEEASKAHGIAFYYQDFREGWRAGQERAKALGMYRQQYCGCVYSEMERFCPRTSGSGKEKSPRLEPDCTAELK